MVDLHIVPDSTISLAITKGEGRGGISAGVEIPDSPSVSIYPNYVSVPLVTALQDNTVKCNAVFKSYRHMSSGDSSPPCPTGRGRGLLANEDKCGDATIGMLLAFNNNIRVPATPSKYRAAIETVRYELIGMDSGITFDSEIDFEESQAYIMAKDAQADFTNPFSHELYIANVPTSPFYQRSPIWQEAERMQQRQVLEQGSMQMTPCWRRSELCTHLRASPIRF